eukprot:Stramenopile-MAST_4_protein_3713
MAALSSTDDGGAGDQGQEQGELFSITDVQGIGSDGDEDFAAGAGGSEGGAAQKKGNGEKRESLPGDSVAALAGALQAMSFDEKELTRLSKIAGAASGKKVAPPNMDTADFLSKMLNKVEGGKFSNKHKELVVSALECSFLNTKEKDRKDEPVRLALVTSMHVAVEIVNKKITKQLQRILGNFEDPRIVHGIRACRDHLSKVGNVPDEKSLEIFGQAVETVEVFHSSWHAMRLFDLALTLVQCAADRGTDSLETLALLNEVITMASNKTLGKRTLFSPKQIGKLEDSLLEIGDPVLGSHFIACSTATGKGKRSVVDPATILESLRGLRSCLQQEPSSNEAVEKPAEALFQRTTSQLKKIGEFLAKDLIPRVTDSVWDLGITKEMCDTLKAAENWFGVEDALVETRRTVQVSLTKMEAQINKEFETIGGAGPKDSGLLLVPLDLPGWCATLSKETVPSPGKSPNVSEGDLAKGGVGEVEEAVGEESVFCSFTDWDTQLDAIITSKLPSDEEGHEKKTLFAKLERTFKRQFKHSKLFVYGSSENLFGSPSSDMDLCLRVDARDAKKICFEIRNALRRNNLGMGFGDIQVIAHARVPIVKFTEVNTGVECDICVDNELAVHNTGLLRAYALLDHRVRYLGLFIKHWAARRGIKRSDQGTLSSYAWVLLSIFWLQTSGVIPCLQIPPYVPEDEEKHAKYDGWNVEHCGPNRSSKELWEAAKAEASKHPASLGKLVYGFFYYYARTLNLSRACVCPRFGTLEPKGNVYGHARRWRICIEDPFDLDHDLGTTVSETGSKAIQKELQRAIDMLEAGKPLDQLCATQEEETNFWSERRGPRKKQGGARRGRKEGQNTPKKGKDETLLEAKKTPVGTSPRPKANPTPKIGKTPTPSPTKAAGGIWAGKAAGGGKRGGGAWGARAAGPVKARAAGPVKAQPQQLPKKAAPQHVQDNGDVQGQGGRGGGRGGGAGGGTGGGRGGGGGGGEGSF